MRSSPASPTGAFTATPIGTWAAGRKQLAVALQELGLQRGDRVATLCWNHYQHLEAYFGIPCAGLVLHTVNIRLHPNEVAYIANHSADRVLIVDRSQLPLYEAVRDATSFDHVFVVEDSYEELLESARAEDWQDPGLDEHEAAAMCYTSGTTGRPKGVLYSHRSTVLHALGFASMAPLGMALERTRHGPTRRPDVPCQRVGLPVRGRPDRRQARATRARTSIPGACWRTLPCRVSPGPPAFRPSGSASSACSTKAQVVGTSRACGG